MSLAVSPQGPSIHQQKYVFLFLGTYHLLQMQWKYYIAW